MPSHWVSSLIVFPVSEPFFPGTDWTGLDWLQDPAWQNSAVGGSSAPNVAKQEDDVSIQVEEIDNRRWSVDVYLRESNR